MPSFIRSIKKRITGSTPEIIVARTIFFLVSISSLFNHYTNHQPEKKLGNKMNMINMRSTKNYIPVSILLSSEPSLTKSTMSPINMVKNMIKTYKIVKIALNCRPHLIGMMQQHLSSGSQPCW